MTQIMTKSGNLSKVWVMCQHKEPSPPLFKIILGRPLSPTFIHCCVCTPPSEPAPSIVNDEK